MTEQEDAAMWGPGPWAGPMWGFWWIFPLLGLLICSVLVFAMIRAMSGGRGFMCMGAHGQHGSEEQAELRREIRELRNEIKELKATR